MKKLVISAVAASMASATALASESEWADLDREVQALSASLAGLESSGVKLGGYIRAAYLMSGDVEVDADGAGPGTATNDLGDFNVLNARLKATGSRGDIGYVLQAGFEDGGSASILKDAYVNIPVGANITVRAGQFKAIVSRDSLVSASKLFFVDRSQIGGLFAGRREGVALMGTFDTFDWAITVQDGSDGAGDDYLIALRGEIDFLGNGVDDVEGAFGAGDEIEGTAGVSYWDDGTLEDGNGLLFQGTLASSMYSVNVWVADISDDLYTSNASSGALFDSIGISGATLLSGDSTPFGVMGTFMVTQPSETQGGWEVGARFQDMDDANDTNIIDIGVNYYGSGHDYKYFLNWTTIDGDGFDGDVISIGLNVGF